jgi:hypothetical protein
MAGRKMTFTLPEDLASRLIRRIPARDRSRYVAAVLNQQLANRDERLIQAIAVANGDPDVRQIEKEFDALEDEIAEPWKGSPSR